jgi:hypothetical protein
MAFTGKEVHEVSLNDAASMTALYRLTHLLQPRAVYFGKDALLEVLLQDQCVGARFYFAMDGLNLTLAFVGVTADENDMLGLVCDTGLRCPPHCGVSNDLNS